MIKKVCDQCQLIYKHPLYFILKKNVSKTDLPFRFCKIGSRNTLFIFGRKNGRLFVLFGLFDLFVLFVLFFLFVAILYPILAYFFFLKPFLKGKILRSSERRVNSILTTILRF